MDEAEMRFLERLGADAANGDGGVQWGCCWCEFPSCELPLPFTHCPTVTVLFVPGGKQPGLMSPDVSQFRLIQLIVE